MYEVQVNWRTTHLYVRMYGHKVYSAYCALLSLVALTCACDKPPARGHHSRGVGRHVCLHRLKSFSSQAPHHEHLLTAGHDEAAIGGHVQGNNGMLVELCWTGEERG